MFDFNLKQKEISKTQSINDKLIKIKGGHDANTTDFTFQNEKFKLLCNILWTSWKIVTSFWN